MDIRYILIKKEIFYRIQKLYKTINSYASQNDILELRIFSAASLTEYNLKSLRSLLNGSYKALIKNLYDKLNYFNLIYKNQSRALIEITKQFDDLMMIAFHAHTNDDIFNTFVKKRVVVDRRFHYPMSLPEYDKDWFKIIKNRSYLNINQNNIIRQMIGLNKFCHISNVRKCVKIFEFEHLYIMSKLSFIKSVFNNDICINILLHLANKIEKIKTPSLMTSIF